MTSLVVVDFGLKENGGHHAAFAESLSNAMPIEPFNSVVLYSHVEIQSEVSCGLDRDLDLRAMFSGRFYHPVSDLSASEFEAVASKFADYYAKALVDTKVQKDDALVLFPTLNFLHLYALEKSLQCEDTQGISIVVCIMFAPTEIAETSQAQVVAEYVRKLLDRRNVSAYASDFELSRAISQWIAGSRPLPIHPSYLADWSLLSKLSNQAKMPSKTKRILLYAGDAKVEKGFDDLPELVELGIEHLPADFSFVVQYTSLWNNPDIAETITALQAIESERVEIIDRYWSNKELPEQLSKFDQFVLLHRCDSYANKSSGLLWLLGVTNKPLVIAEHSWLTREALRLGTNFWVPRERSSAAIVESIAAGVDYENSAPGEQGYSAFDAPLGYREEVYADFWAWLSGIELDRPRGAVSAFLRRMREALRTGSVRR